MKLYLIIYFFLWTLILSSCKNKDPKEDCGCDGASIKSFEGLNAAYRGKGIFSVLGKEKGAADIAGITELIACNIDSSWVISAKPLSPNYTISGNLKKQCPTEVNHIWGGYQPVTISHVKIHE